MVTRIEHIPEYRVVVPGKAESFRSPRAAEYKERVRAAAAALFPEPPPGNRAEVRLDYFHQHPRRFDMDNVAKCVLDALNGLAYLDDQQVRRQEARAYDLREVVHIPGAPADIVKPLRDHPQYLMVRVRYVDKDSR